MTKPSFFPRPDEPPAAEPVATTRAIAELAERHGFIERAPPKVMKKRRPDLAPTASFTLRASVDSLNAFIAWCERERMSYREGFDRLVPFIDRGA